MKRFDVDFYKTMAADRKTSYETIIRGDKFSNVISSATKIAKEKEMDYVEFYHRDFFIGSISKKEGYKFKNGRDFQKNPLKEENKMAKKKLNRLEEVKKHSAQKKKMIETIAKTKSYHTPLERYKNEGKGIDLKLLAELGFKFAEEDKDFLHKTKQELAKGNKKVKELNESFLGLGNYSIIGGNPFGKTNEASIDRHSALLGRIPEKMAVRYPKGVKRLVSFMTSDFERAMETMNSMMSGDKVKDSDIESMLIEFNALRV